MMKAMMLAMMKAMMKAPMKAMMKAPMKAMMKAATKALMQATSLDKSWPGMRASARPALRAATAIEVALLLAAATTLLPAGCASSPSEGYSATSPYPTKYRSVALPIFQNQSYMRGFEFDLADALVKRVEQSTPYKVRSEASADTVLRGTIRAIDLVQLSKDPGTGLANEMMVRMRVDFEWVDLRTGEKIVARDGVEASALFVPSYPARESLELGRFAAVEQLSRDLVDALQSRW